MKHAILMINDELETDPELIFVMRQLRKWAWARGYSPDKPIKISFKADIFPEEDVEQINQIGATNG
jgi:hypothetical protein